MKSLFWLTVPADSVHRAREGLVTGAAVAGHTASAVPLGAGTQFSLLPLVQQLWWISPSVEKSVWDPRTPLIPQHVGKVKVRWQGSIY